MATKENQSNDQTYKIILIGDSGVGKTSVISVFQTGNAHDYVLSTQGSSNISKTIKEPTSGKTLQLEIWDTAGQERYRTLTKAFYKHSHAVIFVYDITQIKTFESIKDYWVNSVKEANLNDVVFALIGNKSDLDDKEEIKEKDARKYAKKIDAIFRQTTIKNPSGIEELFNSIGEKLYQIKGSECAKSSSFHLNDKNNEYKKKGCC